MHSVIRKLALESNQSLPLVDYLIPLVEDKKEIKIVDIGSGPFPRTGQYFEGVKIEIHHCDNQDFSEFWKELGATQLFPIEYQNMEKLTYQDNFFDIVISITAIQNFDDVEKGLKEIKRVGNDRFVLSFLKKSSKREMIDRIIRKNFDVSKVIEEEKDVIYLASQ